MKIAGRFPGYLFLVASRLPRLPARFKPAFHSRYRAVDLWQAERELEKDLNRFAGLRRRRVYGMPESPEFHTETPYPKSDRRQHCRG